MTHIPLAFPPRVPAPSPPPPGDLTTNSQTIAAIPAALSTTTLWGVLNDYYDTMWWNAGCGGDGRGPDRVFTFTANASTPFIDVAACGYNSMLGVVDAASGAMVACGNDIGSSQVLYSYAAWLPGLTNCDYYSAFLTK